MRALEVDFFFWGGGVVPHAIYALWVFNYELL